jgi:mannose-6-phosphate isomerase-like protein (cupin superfamily)
MSEHKNHIFVKKGWGSEEWITNTSKYCGKLLRINAGKKTSWHYHKLKDEVMYVHSGKVTLIHGENEDINHFMTKTVTLREGESFHIPVGLIHQIVGVEDTELFEFSTTHYDEDSYRITKGD